MADWGGETWFISILLAHLVTAAFTVKYPMSDVMLHAHTVELALLKCLYNAAGSKFNVCSEYEA